MSLNIAALESLLASYPADQPIYMLNLIRFKDIAVYDEPQPDLPEISGRDAYNVRYLPAVKSIFGVQGIKAFFHGNALATLVGSETWDEVLIVMYPNAKAFHSMATSEDYRTKCGPHRSAAVADARLFPMSQLEGW